MGLIFLKFADNMYRRYEWEIEREYERLKGTRRERTLSDIAVEKCGFYLPDDARYNYFLNFPEEQDIALAIKRAMVAIEQYKPELRGVLPQDEYFKLTYTDKTIPCRLLKNFSDIPALVLRHTQYAIRHTPYPIRHTSYAIPNTQYVIRNTQ